MKAHNDRLSSGDVAFTPLIARVLALGRGPSALVEWVATRRGNSVRSAEGLARELRQVLRRRDSGIDCALDTVRGNQEAGSTHLTVPTAQSRESSIRETLPRSEHSERGKDAQQETATMTHEFPSFAVAESDELGLHGDPRSPTPLLRTLLDTSLVLAEDWGALPSETRSELLSIDDSRVALSLLVKHRLLTEYQAARVESGRLHGMVIGNYRVLDRIGTGAMGVVFKAEHVRMRQLAAIKVLPLSGAQDEHLKLRFLGEMRAVAQLEHPNIVRALDYGETPSGGEEEPSLHYFAMEYVPGKDLHVLVHERGPLPPTTACELAFQVASALAEAHSHGLIHRDIKPSNIRVTPEGHAKLLDFGLVRHSQNRLTEPGTVLGTLEYLAPEQAKDSSTVDARVDIYGLGGVLFWCLTGQPPFTSEGSPVVNLLRRLNQGAPSVRAWQPDVPVELEAIVNRMMACDPDDRYPTIGALIDALLAFLASNAAPASPDAAEKASPNVPDRGNLYSQHLRDRNKELEREVQAHERDLNQLRHAFGLAFAEIAARRETELTPRGTRLQRYCRCLAEGAAELPAFAHQIDANYITSLECCVPLHDIGKACLPDHLLMESTHLNADARMLLETHAMVGAELLQDVIRSGGESLAFLQMGCEIIRHHHERYDGRGYPDGLRGNRIPLPARIAAIAIAYDEQRIRRPSNPVSSHVAAVAHVTRNSEGQFDPELLQVFLAREMLFERIFRETPV